MDSVSLPVVIESLAIGLFMREEDPYLRLADCEDWLSRQCMSCYARADYTEPISPFTGFCAYWDHSLDMLLVKLIVSCSEVF